MRLAIFGAEGLEGERLIEGLSGLEARFSKLVAVVDDDEADIALYQGRPIRVEEGESLEPTQFDVAVFLKSRASRPALIDAWADAGRQVVDASGHLAAFDDVPLLGLSHQQAELSELPRQLAVADAVSAQVAALLENLPAVKRIDLAVQQPASVLGRQGVETLAAETARLLNGLPVEDSTFTCQLAFNCYSDAEQAAEIEANLLRLLGDRQVEAFCSVAVVPVFHSHLLSLGVEFEDAVDVAAVHTSLDGDDRFSIHEGTLAELNPVALAESDVITISKPVLHRRNGQRLQFCVIADNLRKGVAFNIIAVLNALIKSNN